MVFWIEIREDHRNNGVASKLVSLLEEDSREVKLNHVVREAEEFWKLKGYNLTRTNSAVTGYKKIKQL